MKNIILLLLGCAVGCALALPAAAQLGRDPLTSRKSMRCASLGKTPMSASNCSCNMPAPAWTPSTICMPTRDRPVIAGREYTTC